MNTLRMHPLQLPEQIPEAGAALNMLYQTTRDVRLRIQAHIILLAAEQRLVAHEIGAIVRMSAQLVRRWLKRYHDEGIAGLADAPRPGKPARFTAAFRERLLQLVRRCPRSLKLAFSL